MLLVAGVVVWSAQPNGSSTVPDARRGTPASATPAPSSPEIAAPSPEGIADDPAPAVEAYLAAAASAAPEDGSAGLERIATGALLKEFELEQQELAQNGWTRSGAPTIASAVVVSDEPAVDPSTLVVEACVDSRDVAVLDSSGDPLPTDPTLTPRTRTIFTLTLADGTWLVADRTFPDNPHC